MSPLSFDNKDEFISALQLSIESRFCSLADTSDSLIFKFDKIIEGDSRLILFSKIIGGVFHGNELVVSKSHELDGDLLFNFLLLTRLRNDNMIKLASEDSRYRDLLHKAIPLEPTLGTNYLRSSDEIRVMIFDKIKQEELTLREVAQRTGLTQTALSKFKAGNDIRLSSLLKIIDSLELKLTLS